MILEDLDCALLEHIKDLGAHESDIVPLQRYAHCVSDFFQSLENVNASVASQDL